MSRKIDNCWERDIDEKVIDEKSVDTREVLKRQPTPND